MSCSGRRCGCPQCEGRVSAADPAIQDLRWGLAVARASSAPPFWGIALAADIYDRSGHRGDDPALSDWIDIHRSIASASANLTATVPVLGDGGVLASIDDWHGWVIPGPEWQSPYADITYYGPPPGRRRDPPEKEKKRCCPKSISFDVTADLDDPCRPKFGIEVTAEWSKEPDPCDCDCCEVRQFIRFGLKPVPAGLLRTAADFAVPPYSIVPSTLDQLVRADDPWIIHDLGAQGHFVEDVRFATAYDDAGHATEEESATSMSMQERLRADGRGRWAPHMRRYGKNIPNKSKDPCKYAYTDSPTVKCIAGSLYAEWVFIVVIRPKPHCAGDVLRRLCVLRAGCIVVGLEHGDPKITWKYPDPLDPSSKVEVRQPSKCIGDAQIGPGCGRS